MDLETVVALVGLSSMGFVPLFLIVAIIALFRKKSPKRWFIAMGISAIVFVVCLFIPTCEHSWMSATCTKPKTCSKCDLEEGKPLGHDVGEWSDWNLDHDEVVKVRKKTCSQCEEVVDTETVKVDSFIEENCFSIHPNGFADRFDEQSSRLNGIDYYSKSEYNEYAFFDENNTVFYRIQDKNNNYKNIGIYSFTKPNGETVPVMNEFSENTFSTINILIEKSYDVSAVIYSTILAIDPKIGYSEAADVGQDVLDSLALKSGEINLKEFKGIDYNGIHYLLYKDHLYHYLIVSLSNNN